MVPPHRCLARPNQSPVIVELIAVPLSAGTRSGDGTPPAGVVGSAPGYRRAMRSRTRSRGSSLLGTVLVIWLIIGAVAAFQRGYFSSSNTNCAGVSTSIVTILAGPLNYVGVNPTVDCPKVPQPSK
jgi:hypothetical protein